MVGGGGQKLLSKMKKNKLKFEKVSENLYNVFLFENFTKNNLKNINKQFYNWKYKFEFGSNYEK